jgi:hypothetical protein
LQTILKGAAYEDFVLWKDADPDIPVRSEEEGIRKDQIDSRYALAVVRFKLKKFVGIKKCLSRRAKAYIGHQVAMSIFDKAKPLAYYPHTNAIFRLIRAGCLSNFGLSPQNLS